MKRRKLRSWVKVLIIIIISAFIYSKTGVWGALAKDSNLYLFLCLASWGWLFMGQFIVIYFMFNRE